MGKGEWGMQGLLQGAGWRLGSFKKRNPPWKQISVNFGEMQLKGGEGSFGEQREVHIQICLVEE